jgi:ABC-type transport system involved in multi-copper enzyme maturation permease subunit
MNDHSSTVQAEDLISVGSRISWGAILGGGFVAIAIYFMCTTAGAAVGMSLSDRTASETLQRSALIWSILTFCLAMLVGGLMTSLFTVGENKVEAIFCSVIMWGFVVTAFMLLGAAGAAAGMTGVIGYERATDASTRANLENAARNAGVPTTNDAAARANDPRTPEQIKEAAKKLSWYVFGGTWGSMIAAALGGWLGAGPTFRIVAVPNRRQPVTLH